MPFGLPSHRTQSTPKDTSLKREVYKARMKGNTLGDEGVAKVFEGAQAAIRRDIKTTQKAISNEQFGSRQRLNLERRLDQLRELQGSMKRNQTVDGEKIANTLDARLAAFDAYTTQFRGVRHMREQTDRPTDIMTSRGQMIYRGRVIDKYVGTDKFAEIDQSIPEVAALMDELDRQLRLYGYDETKVRSMFNEMQELTSNKLKEEGEPPTRRGVDEAYL